MTTLDTKAIILLCVGATLLVVALLLALELFTVLGCVVAAVVCAIAALILDRL